MLIYALLLYVNTFVQTIYFHLSFQQDRIFRCSVVENPEIKTNTCCQRSQWLSEFKSTPSLYC